jgi:hypothetical protein
MAVYYANSVRKVAHATGQHQMLINFIPAQGPRPGDRIHVAFGRASTAEINEDY